MNKLFITVLLATFINFTQGQIENIVYKAVADSFEVNYNAANFDAIFASFSTEMQNALPLENTKSFRK